MVQTFDDDDGDVVSLDDDHVNDNYLTKLQKKMVQAFDDGDAVKTETSQYGLVCKSLSSTAG